MLLFKLEDLCEILWVNKLLSESYWLNEVIFYALSLISNDTVLREDAGEVDVDCKFKTFVWLFDPLDCFSQLSQPVHLQCSPH